MLKANFLAAYEKEFFSWTFLSADGYTSLEGREQLQKCGIKKAQKSDGLF